MESNKTLRKVVPGIERLFLMDNDAIIATSLKINHPDVIGVTPPGAALEDAASIISTSPDGLFIILDAVADTVTPFTSDDGFNLTVKFEEKPEMVFNTRGKWQEMAYPLMTYGFKLISTHVQKHNRLGIPCKRLLITFRRQVEGITLFAILCHDLPINYDYVPNQGIWRAHRHEVIDFVRRHCADMLPQNDKPTTFHIYADGSNSSPRHVISNESRIGRYTFDADLALMHHHNLGEYTNIKHLLRPEIIDVVETHIVHGYKPTRVLMGYEVRNKHRAPRGGEKYVIVLKREIGLGITITAEIPQW